MTFSLDDLDRCVHGRHSVDPCYGCPGGQSAGNQCLTVWLAQPGEDVRIGTGVHGEPITITPVRERRGTTP